MASALAEFPAKLREAFRFLQDELGFEVVRENHHPAGSSIEYARGERRVALSYDFKEDCFYFKLIRGANTPYPNDQDTENIILLDALFQQFDPGLDWRTLQPRDRQYEQALELNATLLKKHGVEVLRGETWVQPPPRPKPPEVLTPPRGREVPRWAWRALWVLLVLGLVAGQLLCGGVTGSSGPRSPGAPPSGTPP